MSTSSTFLCTRGGLLGRATLSAALHFSRYTWTAAEMLAWRFRLESSFLMRTTPHRRHGWLTATPTRHFSARTRAGTWFRGTTQAASEFALEPRYADCHVRPPSLIIRQALSVGRFSAVIPHFAAAAKNNQFLFGLISCPHYVRARHAHPRHTMSVFISGCQGIGQENRGIFGPLD